MSRAGIRRRMAASIAPAMVVGVAALATGCAGTSHSGDARPQPTDTAAVSDAARAADAPTPQEVARLTGILATELTPAQDSAWRAFRRAHAGTVEAMLERIVLDRDAPPLARANAVVRLAELGYHDYDVLGQALGDPDPRVRGATLGALSPFLLRDPERVRPLILRGLVDRERAVRAKALQELGDRDPSLLRWFLEQDPPAELAAIARDLLVMAGERGAPLVPDTSGALERTSASGVVLRFEMDSATATGALGRLMAQPVDGERIMLADSVLVVGNVIPAAVSPDGDVVAYERAGVIHAHDLETGATGTVGTGIAPRAFPFTDTFLFAARMGTVRRADADAAAEPDPEAGEEALADSAGVPLYQVLRATYRPGRIASVALVSVPRAEGWSSDDLLRMARIVEVDGELRLVGPGYATPLPSPFTDASAWGQEDAVD